MSTPASLADETEYLDALDAILDAPEDEAASQRLYQASLKMPWNYRYSEAGRERLRGQAARRSKENRGVHLFLIEALKRQDDAEAIAFLLDMLPDEGFSWRAGVALDFLDPVLLARPLRAWLVGRDPEALPEALQVRALRAKIDLASPPESGAVPVTEEILQCWIQHRSFVALRLAFAHGVSAKATLGEGATLLHYAVAAWTNDDQLAAGIGNDDPTRADWEAFIGELFGAGAEADRKLTARFSGDSRHRWPPGTTPRDMLDGERERREIPVEVIDRLEARFPAPGAAVAKARAKKAAKKAKPAPLKPLRDVSFRHAVDEALAGLRGTALGPALDAALADWPDAKLAELPFGPWGYATSLLTEIGKAAPDIAAKLPGWMGILTSPKAGRVFSVVVVGSREETRLLNDMSLASLEQNMERVDLEGWPEEAAALIRKEGRLAYRGDAFLIGKKKGDTTMLWEAGRAGVLDLGTVSTFLTALVEETRRALIG